MTPNPPKILDLSKFKPFADINTINMERKLKRETFSLSPIMFSKSFFQRAVKSGYCVVKG